MTMTDEELDREWKPNGRRPQSTIARSFSQELVDIFRIDESVADLDQKVDRRKHTISLRTSELQSLEARLREMEDRLKNVDTKPGGSSPPRRAAADGAFDEAPAPLAKDQSKRAPPSDLYSDQARPGSNPVGGDMPPTPGASEGITTTMRGHGTQDHLPPAQNPAPHHPRSTNPRPSSQEDGRQHHQTPHINRTDQEDLADFVLISKDDGDR